MCQTIQGLCGLSIYMVTSSLLYPSSFIRLNRHLKLSVLKCLFMQQANSFLNSKEKHESTKVQSLGAIVSKQIPDSYACLLNIMQYALLDIITEFKV